MIDGAPRPETLQLVAPGTSLRTGVDDIVHGRIGGLLVIGEPEELGPLISGGIKVEVDYSPALLYQLAKMDGATSSTPRSSGSCGRTPT